MTYHTTATSHRRQTTITTTIINQFRTSNNSNNINKHQPMYQVQQLWATLMLTICLWFKIWSIREVQLTITLYQRMRTVTQIWAANLSARIEQQDGG